MTKSEFNCDGARHIQKKKIQQKYFKRNNVCSSKVYKAQELDV